ncbi:MAG: DUF935 domain-containing protein [Muribaculaceae bacterium]|nr:DUF935 domain-containing protein [Muribaculaceae bacterium]
MIGNMAKKRKHTSAELKKEKAARVRASVVTELIRTNEYLAKNDISKWRNAWQSAIDFRNPNRQKLYDIYRDAMADAHLSGCIQQRVGFVMSRSFKLVDANGDANEEALHYLDQAWFKDLCRLALDSIWYGHSLIELGDVVTDGDGHPSLSNVTLIPRKHVIPEYGRVVKRIGMTWQSGFEYRKPPFCDCLIEVGQPDNLGLLLKAALHTIPKKHALSFWDCFAEIFGMPMRIARTTTRDPKEFKRIEDMIYDGASNLGMVTGMDTEIQFVESGKGDAYNVYDRRIDRANSELSKLTIGQTMTIEDGSSLSQSQTHLQVFENLVESDRDMLRDVINNHLIPKLIKLGFPLKGLRFEWDYALDYTPEQQIAYEKMVADRYEVESSYFADKYNMPVGKRLGATPRLDGPDEGEAGLSSGERKHSFFD